MFTSRRAASVFLTVAAIAILLTYARPAFAQTQVRVTADSATIWRPGFLSVATVVRSGTMLDVVGRQGDWLEVLLPGGRQGEHGLVSVAQVQVVSGALPT